MAVESKASNATASDTRASSAMKEAQEQRRLLAESARRFVAKDQGPKRLRALRDSDRDFDPTVWGRMAEMGWLGLLTPEAHGGFGLNLADAAPVIRALGGALAPEPLVASCFAARLIALGDNPALQAELLPKIAAGNLVAAVAWEESANGLDLTPVGCRAQSAGGAFTLDGQKDFIRPGAGMGGFVVTTTTGEGRALFWVTAKARGLTVTQRRLADGMLSAKLTLDGVRLDAGAMLASTAVADGIFQQAYAEALILASVELLGVMERALAVTFDYLSTRVQFGKPIGSFQALQHRCVDLFIQKELAAAAIDEGLVAVEHGMTGRALSGLASRIKARASDAALSIGRDAIQLHGAVGFTDEHDIGLYLKRAMVLSSWLGNGAAHRRRYAALQATANRS